MKLLFLVAKSPRMTSPLRGHESNLKVTTQPQSPSGSGLRASSFILLTLYLLVSIFCGFYYCSVPPSPDQSIYDFIGWAGLHGATWYVGTFDVTWPGILFLSEVAIRVFGVHPWTSRLFDYLLLQPSVLAIYFLMVAMGRPRSAILACLSYPIIYVTSGAWMAGQRDLIAMHFLIMSSAILVSKRGSTPVKMGLVGSLVAFATLLRPTYLLFLPCSIISSCVRIRPTLSRASLLTASAGVCGAVVVFGIFIVTGLTSGAFYGWLDAIQLVLSDVYQSQTTRWLLLEPFLQFFRIYIAWLSFATLLALFVAAFQRTKLFPLTLTLEMIATSAISFFVQNKGFGYHLGGMIPLLSILAFGGLEPLMSAHPRHSPRLALLIPVFLALTIAGGLAGRIRHNFTQEWPKPADSDKLALIVAAETCGADLVYQWGNLTSFLFYSQRLSPTRFIATPIFSGIRSDNKKFSNWLVDFDQDLSQNKASFILVDKTATPPNVKDSEAFSLLGRHIAQDYVIYESTPKLELYRSREWRRCSSHQ
jgi:hypothetical protein